MRNKFLGIGQAGFHPLKKVCTCASGLRYAVLIDISVVYKVGLPGIALAISLYFRNWMVFLLVFAVTVIMVIPEMFNTAIEALCDFIETDENIKIAIIKDISAAAVGVSIMIGKRVNTRGNMRISQNIMNMNTNTSTRRNHSLKKSSINLQVKAQMRRALWNG